MSTQAAQHEEVNIFTNFTSVLFHFDRMMCKHYSGLFYLTAHLLLLDVLHKDSDISLNINLPKIKPKDNKLKCCKSSGEFIHS
jgi:hypothetical protein